MRNIEYRRASREKSIRQRRKLAFDLFNQDMYPHQETITRVKYAFGDA